MKKDVIYIDIEDDITAIIEKVKKASAPIVALVPPKRVGVLQSTVNLKLLQRAGNTASKRIVLITNDQALMGLAAGLSMPIAKNLQSKPEIAPIAALESDGDDVINGEELSVGELAQTVSPASEANTKTPFSANKAARASDNKSPVSDDILPAKKSALGAKLPNFDLFRKKLFIFGGLGVLLVAFLVWALVFAGQATIAITARTSVVNISKTLQLTTAPGAKLDAAQAVIPAVIKQTKKANSVDFAATGKKEVGEKATGTVAFENSDAAPADIPAGTQVTSASGLIFTVNTAVTVPKATLTFGNECGPDHLCPGTANTGVTAAGSGTKYNGANGSVSGSFDGASGSFSAPTGGGTDKTATIVSADDIAKAQEQLKNQDANAVKTELTSQFAKDTVVIQEAFVVEQGQAVSAPAVDQEATTAKLTVETTYTLVGVGRSDLKTVYADYLGTQIQKDSQKIYEHGENATQFSQFQKVEANYSVKATATAQVGPNIDSQDIATSAKGKREGEVQQIVGAIQGVKNVDIALSPFWVTRVPDDTKRIKVTFVLENVE